MGHRLQFHTGLCRNLHGHNYDFEVTVSGTCNKVGYVEDFSILKHKMRLLLDQLDHTMLLELGDPALDYLQGTQDRYMILSVPPSAEHLSSLLYNHMQEHGFSVKEVRVKESDGGWASTDRVNRDVRLVRGRV